MVARCSRHYALVDEVDQRDRRLVESLSDDEFSPLSDPTAEERIRSRFSAALVRYAAEFRRRSPSSELLDGVEVTVARGRVLRFAFNGEASTFPRWDGTVAGGEYLA